MMKINYTSSFSCSCRIAAVAIGVLATSPAFAQPADVVGSGRSQAAPAANPAAAYGYNPAGNYQAGGGSFFYQATPQHDPRAEAFQKLSALRKKIQQAGQGPQRLEVITELEAAVGEYFDRDMEYRRAELERLMKRADETEAQHQRRQASRSELIDLQLQSFMHEAEGLGLFGDQAVAPLQVGSSFVLAPMSRASGAYPIQFTQPRPDNQADAQSVEARQAAMARITKAREKLAVAEDADAEGKALEELKAALGEYFDRDMEYRRSELEQIRKGLSRMQARLERRASAKEGIIELQVKMIVNEADGLGFFSGGAYAKIWPEMSKWNLQSGYPGSLTPAQSTPVNVPTQR